jgi:hypothetical protein
MTATSRRSVASGANGSSALRWYVLSATSGPLAIVVGFDQGNVVGARRAVAGRVQLNAVRAVSILRSVAPAARGALAEPFSASKELADPRLCAAIVDQLTFGGQIIETGTASYRLAHARRQQHNAVRERTRHRPLKHRGFGNVKGGRDDRGRKSAYNLSTPPSSLRCSLSSATGSPV